MSEFATNQRINQALLMLTKILQPYVERRLREVYKENWRNNLSLAAGSDPSKPLDAYGLLKTMIDNWQAVFRDGLKPIIRNQVSFALAARNDVAHAGGAIGHADAISYLTSIRAISEAIDPKSAAGFKTLLDDQTKAMAAALGVSVEAAAAKAAEPPAQTTLELVETKYPWKPWRDVAPPHADVMAARFQEAEFAADLSTVARGEGADTYRDPREFFRITYMTGGLRKVLVGAVERLAGKGGEPVIGLQTSFGGGKTHTMLALYHLANSPNPATLPGPAEIFAEAGIAKLPNRPKPPVVFVGTAMGANQPIAVE
uniref:Swt1 family HEPN domain-containing protein n=1 Tax=Rhodoblastus sp. TaxID=1962975 RepID=UPI003F9C3435